MSEPRYEPDDPREWLSRAKGNLRLASVQDPAIHLEELCYNAQQAAEGGSEEMTQRGKTSTRSVDVFTDLGFAPAEAENLRIRSAMMRALIDFVRKNKLTQARAAKLLGVTQPRISDLMCGKIQLFSIDNLVKLLAAAGLRVDLRVKKVA